MGRLWDWLKDSRAALVLVLGVLGGVLWHIWRRARLDRELSQINRARVRIRAEHDATTKKISLAESDEKQTEAARHKAALADLDKEAASIRVAAAESRLALAEKLNGLFP